MSKSRLTITLSPLVLSQLDRVIDGRKIRNRSHAIELLVQDQLSKNVTQAVILCGGEANSVAATMSLVAGQPILAHLVHLLKAFGINKILVVTNIQDGDLTELVASFSGVELIKQDKAYGTAGSLAQISNKLSPSSLLVIHGDVFTDINIYELINFHKSNGLVATVGVKPKMNKGEFGKVVVNGNVVTQFLNKPTNSEVSMINTGVYILEPELILGLEKNKRLMLETDVFPSLVHNRQLGAFLFDGIWKTV